MKVCSDELQVVVGPPSPPPEKVSSILPIAILGVAVTGGIVAKKLKRRRL